MQDYFSAGYERTMEFEGEKTLTDDKLDPGGMTYSGISRVYWPDLTIWRLVDKGMFLEADKLVKIFYRTNFWNLIRGDDVAAISPYIAYEVFDTAVNLSVNTASKFLQQSLNLLNRNQKDYKDILEDGKIGPITIVTTSLCIINNGVPRLLKILNHLQGEHYLRLVRRYPEREEFRGWWSRT